MKAPTAKEIKLAAASVRGTRSAGIATSAAQAAPAVLASAETALDRMLDRAQAAEPSAPSMAAEAAYGRLAGMAVAYSAAVEDLRSALAGQ